jgi:hypothetical protein
MSSEFPLPQLFVARTGSEDTRFVAHFLRTLLT